MSASRAGSTCNGPSRARTSVRKSGMTDPRDAIERREQRVPASPLAVQHLLTVGGDAVEAASPRAGPLDPLALNQPAAFEAVERRIERRDVELERAVGSLVDQLGDFVAVTIAFLEQRQDQDFRAAFAQLAVVGHRAPLYVALTHMSKIKLQLITRVR